jgi:serine/threonine protein kinase
MIDGCNSFGITMHEIMNRGIVPFIEYSNAEVASLVTSKKAKLVKPEDCPDELFQLILRCTSFNPEDRPSFKQVHVDTLLDTSTEFTQICAELQKFVQETARITEKEPHAEREHYALSPSGKNRFDDTEYTQSVTLL